ncbi:type III secretion system stator protein SctL [Pseudomonas mucidolens]|uniref:type III secretion system stator protein SctL n=1 Tax=Pseudomonas mucidolens TaxID=46679 RepID=UPI0030D77F03
MLSLRKIKLHPEAAGLSQPVISRETLIDCGRAEALLKSTQVKAQEMLQHAEQDRERLIAQARAEFWKQANTQLQRWEAERQAMNSALENHATHLVNTALQQLLGEVVAPQRLNALLRQLIQAKSTQVKVTLRCNPHTYAQIQGWLARDGANAWHLQPDASLCALALVLETEEGDLRIDWETAVSRLLLNEHEPLEPTPHH